MPVTQTLPCRPAKENREYVRGTLRFGSVQHGIRCSHPERSLDFDAVAAYRQAVGGHSSLVLDRLHFAGETVQVAAHCCFCLLGIACTDCVDDGQCSGL